jgi:hypothetical protein
VGEGEDCEISRVGNENCMKAEGWPGSLGGEKLRVWL